MGLANYKEAHEYDHQLKVCTPQEAAQVLIGKKKICILTGAGISASSGIPTFRGEDGFWKTRKQYADEADPCQICTLEFFEKHANANWEWHYDFQNLKTNCAPNKGHYEILKFQEHCALNDDMESMLVTQNVDDYHEMVAKESPILSTVPDKNLIQYGDDIPLAFTPHVYALHGNTAYMHCWDTSCAEARTFHRIPSRDQVKDIKNHVPKCKECGEDMKPHGMFFDESYNEHFYRSESIGEFYTDCDAMIVIGTTLLTSYAKQMVIKTLDREVPVIEINYEPCLQVGHTYQVLGKSDDTLPAMFDAYYKALGIKHVNQDLYAAHFKPSTQDPSKQNQQAENWKKEECKQEKPAQNLKKPVAAVTKAPISKTPAQVQATSKPQATRIIQKAPVTSTSKAPTTSKLASKKK